MDSPSVTSSTDPDAEIASLITRYRAQHDPDCVVLDRWDSESGTYRYVAFREGADGLQIGIGRFGEGLPDETIWESAEKYKVGHSTFQGLKPSVIQETIEDMNQKLEWEIDQETGMILEERGSLVALKLCHMATQTSDRSLKIQHAHPEGDKNKTVLATGSLWRASELIEESTDHYIQDLNHAWDSMYGGQLNGGIISRSTYLPELAVVLRKPKAQSGDLLRVDATSEEAIRGVVGTLLNYLNFVQAEEEDENNLRRMSPGRVVFPLEHGRRRHEAPTATHLRDLLDAAIKLEKGGDTEDIVSFPMKQSASLPDGNEES